MMGGSLEVIVDNAQCAFKNGNKLMQWKCSPQLDLFAEGISEQSEDAHPHSLSFGFRGGGAFFSFTKSLHCW